MFDYFRSKQYTDQKAQDLVVGQIGPLTDSALSDNPNDIKTRVAIHSTELIEARTGANGKVYSNVGDALKSQVSNIYADYSGKSATLSITTSTLINGTDKLYTDNIETIAGNEYVVEISYSGTKLTALDVYTQTDHINSLLAGRIYPATSTKLTFTASANRTGIRFSPFLNEAENGSLTIKVYVKNTLGYKVNTFENTYNGYVANPQNYKTVNLSFTTTGTRVINYNFSSGKTYYIKLSDYSGTNFSNADIYTGDLGTATSQLYGSIGFTPSSLVFTATTDATQLLIWNTLISPESATMTVIIEEVMSSLGRNLFETIKPDIGNVLVLGDSYSAIGTWIAKLKTLTNTKSVIKVAVGSATLRDKYTDRVAYPYTSRPVQSELSGNLNTFACQIEKLKRLMAGTDLDEGQTQIYTSEIDYPNTIYVQGGTNDGVDTDEEVVTYIQQLYQAQAGVYVTDSTGTNISTAYVKSDIDTIDRTCYMGAIRYLYEELHELFPKAKIYFITPAGLSYGTGNNIQFYKKADQIRYCCNLLSIPTIDWDLEGRLNYIDNYMTGSGTELDPYVINGVTTDTTDTLHPNESGSLKLAEVVAKGSK